MSHIILTKLDKNGEKPEKVLVNIKSIIYINPDQKTKVWHWLNMDTMDGVVCWRIKESSDTVDELISDSHSRLEE